MRHRFVIPRARTAVAAAAVLAAAGAVAAGLGADRAEASRPGLERFESCEAFLRYVEANAAAVGPYALAQEEGQLAPGQLPAEDVAAAPEAETPAAGSAPGPNFSTTNVQEAGVDEPDVVETDGSRIFALANGTLYAVDAAGESPRVVGTLDLPAGGADDELLLQGDRLLLLSRGPHPIAGDLGEGLPTAPGRTTLAEIDVTDPAAMRVVRELVVDGSLVAASLVDSTVRVVLTSSPSASPLATPAGTSADVAEAVPGSDVAVAPDPGSWIPSYRLVDHEHGTVRFARAVECSEIARPSDFAGLGLLTVLTIDLDRGLEPVDADAVLASGETVYASQESLYVATRRWVEWTQWSDALPPADEIATEIHRFDTSAAGSTVYRSSGTVAGALLNQFSLSEHDGYLRVASTAAAPWEPPGAGESRVTVLAERGGRLEQVGLVTGLGKGERIYAVRFLGDTGYVVTFREVDPLYVLDLSEPTRPAVTGELKITGYSSYLHPVGDDLLLGVGQDATTDGLTLGAQVSLFDVSDPANPRLLDRRRLAGAWSEAEIDHHAFLWWPRTRLAVLPVELTQTDASTGETLVLGGAIGLRVGKETLSGVGSATHPAGQIRRSLVIGGTLYTLSDAGILASDVETLGPEGWIPFR